MFRGLIVVAFCVVIGVIFALLGPIRGESAGTAGSGHGQNGAAGPSGKEHQATASVPTKPLAQLITGNSLFAFDLYQELRREGGNFLYSPYSISQALAMTYAGARNRTERQMADTLGFTLGQKHLHSVFRNLHEELVARGEGARGRDGQPFRLHIANALWGQKGYGFLSSFLDVVADNYGAGLRLVDFRKDSDGARVIINNWVMDETEGKIKDLFPAGTISSATRLVLTNAIYFNAAWLHPFEEQNTRDEDFNLLDGSRVRVPMMSQTASFGRAKSEGVQAVELGYDGGQLSMVVLLPEGGWLASVDESLCSLEESLNAEWVASVLADLKQTKVKLTMPRFKYESAFSLNRTLAKMGMPDAFDRHADFSGMTGKRNLQIDHVVHKTYVSVDESGTEAAAATGVAMTVTSMQPKKPPIVVRIDRPFVYLIRDIKTGTILFVGRVVDPRGVS